MSHDQAHHVAPNTEEVLNNHVAKTTEPINISQPLSLSPQS